MNIQAGRLCKVPLRGLWICKLLPGLRLIHRLKLYRLRRNQVEVEAIRIEPPLHIIKGVTITGCRTDIIQAHHLPDQRVVGQTMDLVCFFCALKIILGFAVLELPGVDTCYCRCCRAQHTPLHKVFRRQRNLPETVRWQAL